MGKFLTLCYLRWKHFLFGFLSFLAAGLLVCLSIGLVGDRSNFMHRTETARVISDAAYASSYGAIRLNASAKNCESRSDYVEIFNQAFTLDGLNFNRLQYNCWSVFDRDVALFNQSWSISFSGYGFSNEQYNESLSLLPSPFNSVNTNSGGSFHEIYRFKLMFGENRLAIPAGCTNFFFLPESLADELLLKDGVSNPTVSDYERLIGLPVEFLYSNLQSGEELPLSWSIANIILEDDTYTQCVAEFGPFIPCYLGLPSFTGASVSLRMRKSVFSNRWYLDYLNEHYHQDAYVYSLNLKTVEGLSHDQISAAFDDAFVSYSSGLSTFAVVAFSLAISVVFIGVVQTLLILGKKPSFHFLYVIGFAIGASLSTLIVWYILLSPLSLTLYLELASVLLVVIVSAFASSLRYSHYGKARLVAYDNFKL